MKYSNRFFYIHYDSETKKYFLELSQDAQREMDVDEFELMLQCFAAAYRDIFE